MLQKQVVIGNQSSHRPLTAATERGSADTHTHIMFIDKLQHLPISTVLKLESLYRIWSRRLRVIFHHRGNFPKPRIYLALDHPKIYHLTSLHQCAVLSIPQTAISYVHCTMLDEAENITTLKHLTLLK